VRARRNANDNFPPGIDLEGLAVAGRAHDRGLIGYRGRLFQGQLGRIGRLTRSNSVCDYRRNSDPSYQPGLQAGIGQSAGTEPIFTGELLRSSRE
jgi:hypothetical protein